MISGKDSPWDYISGTYNKITPRSWLPTTFFGFLFFLSRLNSSRRRRPPTPHPDPSTTISSSAESPPFSLSSTSSAVQWSTHRERVRHVKRQAVIGSSCAPLKQQLATKKTTKTDPINLKNLVFTISSSRLTLVTNGTSRLCL